MENPKEKDNQDSDLVVSLSTITDILFGVFQNGTEKILKYIDDENLDVIKDVAPNILGLIDGICKLKKLKAIPDRLFLIKYKKYCQGVVLIPKHKREQYIKTAGKTSLNKDCVFILQILNNIEELEKISIFIKLFEAKVYNYIDDKTYRRMMIQANRTLYSDLLFLRDNISESNTILDSIEKENLLATGWLRFKGIAPTFLDKPKSDEGRNVYIYTDLAKKFCRLVFNDYENK